MAHQVYAVVSHLSGEAQAEVLAMWELLERRFGVRAAQDATYPHLTYFVGDGGDASALADGLDAAARTTPQLSAAVDGLGLFPGAMPVLFLRVVQSAALTRVYDRAASAARRAGVTLWPHYAADAWVPHVTLALRDVRPAAMPAIIAELGRRRSRFRTPIRDLRLVRVAQPLSGSEYIGVFPLGGRP